MSALWVIAFILQWIVLLILSLLMIGVLRYLRALQENFSSALGDHSRFELGDLVGDFQLPDVSGHIFASKSLFENSQKVLFLFLNATCNPCKAMIQMITELVSREGGLETSHLSVVLICKGELAGVQSLLKDVPPQSITTLVDKDSAVFQQYEIKSTPFAILADHNRKLLSQSAQPASAWLYTVLGVHKPAHSLVP